ncbi:NAD(P)-binding protein [Lentinus tigrinus ALCF2SS1-6]|uniref:NAD(P)-binding protein n=1 Tax=Lentinus tigrinus ALCF2SS1-6 TaxID=1328759 RepID=A0A5C2SJF6_9APHY|nr:NAD(P)-binding protein [Lentinus tigrinus ALCF2SS1-6]
MASDLFSVADRVAVVTGASSGIGSYIAQGLARAGAARVYISGRRAAQLEKVAQAAPGVLPLVGDVSTIKGCKELADTFVAREKKVGVEAVKLDLLVNNAGMGAQEGDWAYGASVEEIRDALLQASDADWAKVNAVNVGSLQWVSATLLPYLVAAASNGGKREGRGCIVNNTSVSAFFVSPQVKGHLYAASKAAAESMTLNLVSKFTRLGVRVNSIAPANVPSELNSPDDPRSFISAMKDIIPFGRIGNEEDVTGAVIYLASRAGSYISGNVIKLDGGSLIGVEAHP